MSQLLAESFRAHGAPDHRARERLAFLEKASRVLALSLDTADTLAAVAELAVPAMADWCSIDLVEDGRPRPEASRFAFADPSRAGVSEILRRYHRIVPGVVTLARVLAGGGPELVREVTREQLAASADGEEHLALLESLEMRSWITVPLRARGRVLGVLSLVTAESGRRYDEDDFALAQELALRASVAIDNARLHAALGEARRQAERVAQRTARLQAVTGALAGALTPRDVGAVVLGHAVEAMEAVAGMVGTLSEDAGEVHLLETRGFAVEAVEAFRRLPMGVDLPLADAIREGRPVFLGDRSARVRTHTYLDAVAHENCGGALAALPLCVDGRTIGALELVFAGPQTFNDEERGCLLALAGCCAQALERARLGENQRKSLVELEETTRRLRALQVVTDVALGHLELDPLLDALLERVVRALAADVGEVLLACDRGLHVRASHGVCQDPLPGVRIPQGRGVADRIAASRQAMILDSPNDDLLGPTLKARGIRVLAGAPLLAGDRLLGVLHVGSWAPGAFHADDLELLRVAAERAAVAVERAALYGAERSAARENGRLYEESRRALAARDDLLAIVSHDLRNPLGAIVLNASALEHLLPEGTCAQARRQLWLLQRSAERMNRMVASLLDAESVEAGAFGLDPAAASAARLVDEAVEMMADLAASRSLDLAAEIDEDSGEVRCDRERILQVFSNLLANAIRFSPQGATVAVGCSPAGGGEVRFWVRDSGPGVDSALRERIFERHFQGRRGPGSGLGLGLYIARGIVTAHGGRIWCEPAEGRGTTFVFTLPGIRLSDAGASST